MYTCVYIYITDHTSINIYMCVSMYVFMYVFMFACFYLEVCV